MRQVSDGFQVETEWKSSEAVAAMKFTRGAAEVVDDDDVFGVVFLAMALLVEIIGDEVVAVVVTAELGVSRGRRLFRRALRLA